MSLFSKLFGKKEDNKNEQEIPEISNLKFGSKVQQEKTIHLEQKPVPNKNVNNVPSIHLKGKPDIYGLYPSELVMLSYIEGIKTTETNYPKYLTFTYEIANPLKMIKNLESRELIEKGNSKDTLPNLKLTELKDLASSLGITVKGRKADIIEQLSIVDEKELECYVKERTWKLTEKGQSALKANPYIQYFTNSHPYDVSTVGVNIWSVNEEFVKNTKRPYRDIIFRQLNDEMNKAAITIQTDPNANTFQYCECYRLMGLFIEEEGKSFVNAADLYFQYLYKKINIHAGLKLLKTYNLFMKDKEHQANAIKWFYEDAQLNPYERTELLRLIDELGIEGTAVRYSMITSIKRANDIGIMNEEEAANFIILELSGETDKSRDLAYKLAKNAIKRK